MVKEYLKNGEMRSIKEIGLYLNENGVSLDKNMGCLRNALSSMKLEHSGLCNPKRGIYCWNDEDSEEKPDIGEPETRKTESLDGYIVIKPQKIRKRNMSIHFEKDGTMVLGTPLLRHFPSRQAEMRLKKDGTQLLLIKEGNTQIYLGKKGRAKNHAVVDYLKKLGLTMPVYYTGEWDEKGNVWMGTLTASMNF